MLKSDWIFEPDILRNKSRTQGKKNTCLLFWLEVLCQQYYQDNWVQVWQHNKNAWIRMTIPCILKQTDTNTHSTYNVFTCPFCNLLNQLMGYSIFEDLHWAFSFQFSLYARSYWCWLNALVQKTTLLSQKMHPLCQQDVWIHSKKKEKKEFWSTERRDHIETSTPILTLVINHYPRWHWLIGLPQILQNCYEYPG